LGAWPGTRGKRPEDVTWGIQIFGGLAERSIGGQKVRFPPRMLEMASVEPGDHVVGGAFVGVVWQLLAFLVNVPQVPVVVKPQNGKENDGKDELEKGERGAQQEYAQTRWLRGLAHAAEEGGDEPRDDQDEEVGPEDAPEEPAVREGLKALLVGELGFLMLGLRSHWA